MRFEVETNVPVPLKKSETSVSAALRNLEVGHSLLFTNADRSKVASLAYRVQRNQPGRKHTVRSLGDGQCRVWRIA